MKLYYSIPDEAFIQGPGIRQKLTSLDGLKRALQGQLEVQFLDGENAETPTTLVADSFLDFGLKLDGKFENDWLAHVEPDDWTQPKAGDQNPWYRAALNLNTTELNTAFLTPNANLNDDAATVATMTVFTAREPAFDTPNHIADKLDCAVANSGNIGSEGVPVLAQPGITTRLSSLEANSAIFLPAVTAYGGGGSTAFDGVVTTTLAVNTFAVFNHATNGIEVYLLTAGTTAASVPSIIHPLDYNASTNAKIWIRKGSSVLLAIANGATAAEIPITNTANGSNVLAIRNISNTGYSAVTIYDDVNTQRVAFGWGNSGTGGFSDQLYFLTIGNGGSKKPFYFYQNDGSTTATSLAIGVNGNLTLGFGLIASVQALSGSGALTAVSVTSHTTTIATSGAATSTLAAGATGQIKRVYMITDGGDCVVTVTNLQGGTTITFNDQDDFVDLQYLNAKWKVIQNSGCTIA